MVRKASISILSFVFILSVAFSSVAQDTVYAGLRCSEYGLTPMPTTAWLGKTVKNMALRFEKPGRVVIPCVVWITSTFDAATTNSYLTYFDNNGIKALLQSETYEGSVLDFITSDMTNFKSHPCVIGCGIDIEWYFPDENNGLGRKVTDNDAKTWRAKVKSYNPNYLLLLKHFFPGWEPPTERTGILFLDDSQQFPTFERFLNETDPSTKWNIGYRFWSNSYKPSGISGMQYGYDDADGGPSDKLWWIKLKDPQKEIGDSCLQVGGSNTKFLFWVDFTAQDPDVKWNFVTETKNEMTVKSQPTFITVQNRTVSIHHKSLQNGKAAAVSLFDLNGKLVLRKHYTDISSGITVKLGNYLSKGIYLVQVESGNQILSNRISLY